ncbi:MAG TPA: OPT family oligopeptide transporter [Phycisphaerae bacterium]|nr:OPT family oligopeptide transporter [Phycisphaerae bacterium]
MAIKQLTEDQIRTMAVEEKDRWWLENVFQGDVPQMTVRVVICGFLLGGLLSITNLYVGAKTGWSLGVAITSVILAFVIFKVLQAIGLARNYHVLENNILQSIACSAGYMNGPLFASMAAYMIITNQVIPWWQMIMWLMGLCVMGVLFAFPLKRRFINEDQLPFPEGRAAGVVLDTLHSGESGRAILPAKLLVIFGVIGGVLKLLQWGFLRAWLEPRRLGFLRVPEMLDEWYYRLAAKYDLWIPRILGTPLRELTIRPELDVAMIGAGGLMGIRTGVSLMIGAVVNYFILAPIMIQRGDIKSMLNAAGEAHYGFTPITRWALWCGVAMMTTASLMAFFAKPQMLVSAFSGIFRRKKRTDDCLKHVELPLWVSLIGVPIVGAYLVYIAHWFFDVQYWMGAVAVPMVFVFTLIGVNSTALTSITPTGALGKLTQLTYGVLAPGNFRTNIATAGISAEVAGSASNLIQNIKPGYMLGGKARLQAIGHVIGGVAGAGFSVAVFYPLFLRNDPAKLISEQYPYPAATVWKAVAEILTEGLSRLPHSAVYGAAIGAVLGILVELVRVLSKGKFPISPVGIGLAFVIPFTTCFAMFFGSFVFWVIGKLWPKPEQRMNEVIVQNQESICAGLIAGAALIAVGLMVIEVVFNLKS